jgi:hypothetical protein
MGGSLRWAMSLMPPGTNGTLGLRLGWDTLGIHLEALPSTCPGRPQASALRQGYRPIKAVVWSLSH